MEINEHKARIDAGRGARAQSLLSDELLNEAFQTLEDAYVHAWKNSTIDDVGGREKRFLAVNLLGQIKTHLLNVVRDGKLAEDDLRRLAETAERKKAWHEIR